MVFRIGGSTQICFFLTFRSSSFYLSDVKLYLKMYIRYIRNAFNLSEEVQFIYLQENSNAWIQDEIGSKKTCIF